MVVARSGVDEVAAFVHTHGARLVRLAHLLDVPDPLPAAAGAMASTMLRRGRSDAHEDLLAAARAVAAHAQPPVREDARLQGWLDRAELESYETDLDALRSETADRLASQRRSRNRTRRRAAAGTAAALLVLAGASLLTGGPDDAEPPPTDGLGRLRPTSDSAGSDGPGLVGLPPAGSVVLPRQLQSAQGVLVADILLLGPAVPIARVDVAAGRATMLAVQGVTRDHTRVVCVLAIPDGQTLLQADEADLVGVVPTPTPGRLLSGAAPLRVRQSVVEDYRGRNLLLDVTSSRIDRAIVTLSDGKVVEANRYPIPGGDSALFVTVDDDSAAVITYVGHDRVLRRRSLWTATP